MMTEKRKADTARFRQRIDAHVEFLRKPIAEGGCALTQYEIERCLAFARFTILAYQITLRELKNFEHPEDCLCQRCDYRPEVERSVEEVRGNG